MQFKHTTALNILPSDSALIMVIYDFSRQQRVRKQEQAVSEIIFSWADT